MQPLACSSSISSLEITTVLPYQRSQANILSNTLSKVLSKILLNLLFFFIFCLDQMIELRHFKHSEISKKLLKVMKRAKCQRMKSKQLKFFKDFQGSDEPSHACHRTSVR